MSLPQPSERWYFKDSAVVIAFVCVGPLALPLVWFNPRYSAAKKIVITLISLLLTYFLAVYTVDSVKKILAYYREISAAL